MWVALSGFKLSAQKIYNVVVKIKKNRMQGQNTIEEVLCLSAKRNYMVFYRNREGSNMLSDIVFAYPTSIEMLRMWSYVLIMDTTYKTNKYNMPLLEVVGMTPTGKNFTVASAFMRNEQATTYRWEYLRKLDALKMKWKSRPDFLHYLFNNWLNPFAHKFVRCWTKNHMHFGVETTNRAESEHSVLKLWLSTCHGDLDTVFLNIDSLIEGQITDIKASLEFSKTKEKNNAKSNHIFYIVSNKISHLVLQKIWSEITRAAGIYDDPKNKCEHYLKTSHGLPCACELIKRFDHVLPTQSSSFNRQQDMDSEMRSLTDLLHQISTEPISKVREMRRLAKGVLNLVLPEDPGVTLTSPPEVAVTKGQKKTNSTKRDESHWEHVSIAHRKIQKLSGSGFGSSSSTRSGSWSGSGFGSGSHERGRPPRTPRRRGRGRDRGRSSLSAVIYASPSSKIPYTNAFSAFIYLFISNWKKMIGDGNYGYWVVVDFVFDDEHQRQEVRRRMLYELEHSTNVYVNLVGSVICVNELVHRIHWPVDEPAPYQHWFETPDSLYIIANAFNLCVILIVQLGSTTVLPLYSYSDGPGGTLVIGLLTEQQHFIQLNDMSLIPPLHVQWIHHRTE
ncbi:hypothetical protein M9H77_09570 [Catharanthus roseus]|uniref:Uncharacterized protein n=1 Tax=Catharanthus roseus TaxID=4058 RepID=A0ACC0C107_CATRO|nr:hypothetical protein M9H77_09570 [Catharanthus roseus]